MFILSWEVPDDRTLDYIGVIGTIVVVFVSIVVVRVVLETNILVHSVALIIESLLTLHNFDKMLTSGWRRSFRIDE